MTRAYELVGDRRTNDWGAWFQTVRVAGREYIVSVARDKRVRIPFKPRGANMGWTYRGTVRTTDGADPRVDYSATVGGSIGVRGLLTYAGVITSEQHGEKCRCNACGTRRYLAYLQRQEDEFIRTSPELSDNLAAEFRLAHLPREQA